VVVVVALLAALGLGVVLLDGGLVGGNDRYIGVVGRWVSSHHHGWSSTEERDLLKPQTRQALVHPGR
jgi:hypothetical protein